MKYFCLSTQNEFTLLLRMKRLHFYLESRDRMKRNKYANGKDLARGNHTTNASDGSHITSIIAITVANETVLGNVLRPPFPYSCD